MTTTISKADRKVIREMAAQMMGANLYYVEYHAGRTLRPMASLIGRDGSAVGLALIGGVWQVWA